MPTGLDIVIALAIIAMSVAEAALTPSVLSPLQHLLVAVPCLGSLAWRRQFPLAVALIVVAGDVYLNPSNQFAILLSVVLVAYTVGSETSPPRSYVGLGVALVPYLAGMIIEGLEPSDIGAALVFIVGPWVVGTAVRQRADRAKAAVARAEQLEADAAQAAEAERTRIARELHDIVSHSISVVTIQTQRSAGGCVPTRPGRPRTSPRSRPPPGRRWPRCVGCSGCCAQTESRPPWLRSRAWPSSGGWSSRRTRPRLPCS
jgi:signal transduction histidine kinase